MAVAIFDQIMNMDSSRNQIQWLRESFTSCKGVISE
jgi:hypothetical protein